MQSIHFKILYYLNVSLFPSLSLTPLIIFSQKYYFIMRILFYDNNMIISCLRMCHKANHHAFLRTFEHNVNYIFEKLLRRVNHIYGVRIVIYFATE